MRRLVCGQAHYVDDIRLPPTLHVAFERSPHAHARVRGIDGSRAPLVISETSSSEAVTGVALEARACLAAVGSGVLTLWSSHQTPHVRERTRRSASTWDRSER